MAKHLNVNLSFSADTAEASRKIESLNQQLKNLSSGTNIKSNLGITQELSAAMNSATRLQSILQSSLNTKTNTLDLGKFKENLDKSGMSLKQYAKDLNALGPEGSKAFAQLAQSITTAEVPLRRTNAVLNEFATTLKNTARWQISSSILHGFMGSVQHAYRYAQDLNESLNNIRIVTGYSTDRMADFAVEANKAAKALSTTTTEYTNASLIYFQQGLNDKEVAARTDTTIKMANVARQSAEVVSDQMTAVWNNFYDGSKSLEYYADVMTALGAATASSTDEISTGLNKFAAVSNTVGLSYEYAASALATVTATTRQSADVVGTAFRTLFTRIQGLSLGETLDDGVTLNKYSEALNAVGVNIMDQFGQLKDMDTILAELGDKWGNISKEQQVGLAQTIGGARQYATLIALMDNWDFFQENLQTSLGSEGALSEQAEIYAESWEAARDRVSATAEGIYSALLDDEFFIDLTNLFADLLEIVKNTTDAFGGMKGVLAIIGTLMFKAFGSEMSKGIQNIAYNFTRSSKNYRDEIKAFREETNALLKDSVKDDESIIGSTQYSIYQKQAELQDEYLIKNQEILDIGRELTTEEQKRLQLILDTNQALADRVIKSAEGHEEAQDALISDIGRQSIIANRNGFNRSELSIYANMQKEYTATFSYVQKLQKAFDKFESSGESSFEDIKKSVTNFRDSLIELNGTLSRDVAKAFEDVINASSVSELESAIGRLDFAVEDLGDQIYNRRENLINFAQDSQAMEDSLNIIEESANRAGSAMGRQAQDQANYNQVLEDSINNIQNFEIQSFGAADGLVAVGEAASASLMVFNTFKGVFDSWNNEDLSVGDKLITTFTSLATIIPMVTMAFNKNTLSQMAGLSAFILTKAGLDSTTASAIAAGGAIQGVGIAMTSIILPIMAVIAAIALVVAGIDALIKWYNKDAIAAERAAEAAKKQKEALNETKQAYDELKSTIEDYKGAEDALSKLTEGTEEWHEAVNKVNETVLELLDKYPELSQYIDNVDGKLSIQKEGLEVIQKLQWERVQAAQRSSYMAEANALNKENTSLITNFSRNSVLPNNFTETLVNEINFVGAGFLKDAEGIQEVLGPISEEYVDAILDNKDALIKLANELNANTRAAEIYNQKLGESLLEGNELYEASTIQESTSKIVGDYITNKASELYESGYKDKGKLGLGMSDAEVQKAYAELIGASNFKNLGDNMGKYFIDGQWKEIDDETARMALAFEAASKGAEGLGEELINLAEDVSGSDAEVASALLSFNGGTGQSGDLSNLSVEQLQNLTKLDISQSQAMKLGYNSLEELQEYILEAVVSEYNRRLEREKIEAENAIASMTSMVKNSAGTRFSMGYGEVNETNIQRLLDSTGISLVGHEGISADTILAGIDFTQMPTEGIEEWWIKAFNESLDNAEFQRDMANKIAEINSEAQNEGLDSSEITEYADHLRDVADESDLLSDELLENEAAAQIVAKAVTRMNRGIESLKDNIEDWSSVLKNSDKASLEYQKAMEGLRTSMADVLDIGEEWVSSDFLENNLEDIEKAASGSAEAIDRLRVAAAKDIVIKVQPDMSEQAQQEIISLIDTISMEIPDIEVGATIDSGNFLAIAQDIVDKAGLTAEQANAMFESIGFEPTFVTTQEPIKQVIPTYETTAEITGLFPLTYRTSTREINDPNNVVEGFAEVPAMSASGTPVIKSLTRKSSGSMNNFSSSNKGGGSSKTKPKQASDEIDRYHEIKEVIEDLNREMDRLGKAKDRAWGKSKLDLIDQEIGKVEEAIAVQKEYLDQISANIGPDQSAIAAYGATFDEMGRITNYEELIQSQVNKYNSMVASGDEDAAEEQYEKFKKALEQYEETADLYEDEWEKLVDLQNEFYDKLLEKVEYTVELNIEISDTKLKYLDYLIERLGDDAYRTSEEITALFSNLTEQTEQAFKRINTYQEGIEAIFANHGADAQDWLNGKMSNEQLVALGFTEAEIEALIKYQEGLIEENKSLIEIKDSIINQITESFNGFNEEMQKGIDKISYLKNIMNSFKNIVDLVGKQKLGISDETIANMNNALVNMSIDKLASSRTRTESLKAAMDELQARINAETNEEIKADMQKTFDEMQKEYEAATEDMLGTWEETLQQINDVFNEAVNTALTNFERRMAAGYGSLDALLTASDRAKTIDEQYLSDYRQIYELSKLTRDINNSIDNTDNLQGKRELKELLNEINEIQNQGVQMSAYDLEYLQKKYDLRLAEIALEDAQNAKNQVRMTRDADGNWSYTYTADESAVDGAAQNYEDKLYALQETSNNYLNQISEQWIQSEKEWSEALASIYQDAMLSEEERQLQIDETNLFYQERFAYFTSEIEKATGNNKVLYEEDWRAYLDKTEQQIASNEDFQTSFNDTVLGTLYDGFDTVKELQSELNAAIGGPGEDGTLLGDLSIAYADWSARVDEAMDTAGIATEDFDETMNEVADNTEAAADQMARSVEDSANDMSDAFGTLLDNVDSWLDAYRDKIEIAIKENELLAESVIELMEILGAESSSKSMNSKRAGGSGGGGGSVGGNGGNGSNPPTQTNGTYKYEYTNRNGVTKQYATRSDAEAAVDIDVKSLPSSISPEGLEEYRQRWLNSIKEIFVPFKTGGYTGTWGSSGKLAMLHEKELVLNKDDTENFLSAVNMIREITRIIDLNTLGSLMGLGVLKEAQSITDSNQIIEQEVTIHAEFPNATNHNEIEEAFNNLINTASQYANRKKI